MADQHHDEPDVPGLPQIQDEAADTPMWLPATGLGLLVIMVLMLVYHVAQGPETASQRQAREALRRAVKSGRLEAAEVAAMTFDAIRDNRFYVLTHPRILDSVRLRHADIEATRNPSDPYGTRPDVPRPT